MLQLSQSAVSLSVAELLGWGKTWRPGERRDYYEVEASVWKLVRRVFERRELNLIAEAADSFARADSALQQIAAAAETSSDKDRIAHMRRRLSKLRALSKVGERLLRKLVAGRSVDPSELHAVQEQPT